ncbi:hypothetical protein GTY65_24315 [Streptomyces sp. SID8379]|uniref:hypothetical protein n=1 Tax=unclassified Streptomyces TaxID=2593676 RepID=UPI00036E893A|nr:MULTISPECIES: hypothetical protein [unclassified Streptomyces]MYW67168.1 hypothetical protein [Streptomyces sp. SID8379]
MAEQQGLWWKPPQARFRPTTDARLNALRHSFYGDAIAALKPGRAVTVTTYVLASPGVDVDATHELLGRHARDRGWTVHRDRFTDTPVNGPLPIRPQFNLACRHAGAGFATGVLAVGRAAMPSTDETYESYLHWLHSRCAFIAFLQPQPGGSPWDAQ